MGKEESSTGKIIKAIKCKHIITGKKVKEAKVRGNHLVVFGGRGEIWEGRNAFIKTTGVSPPGKTYGRKMVQDHQEKKTKDGQQSLRRTRSN